MGKVEPLSLTLYMVESMQQDRASAGTKALTGSCTPLDKGKKRKKGMVSMENQTQIIQNSLLTFYPFPFPLLIRVTCLKGVA